MTDVDRPPDGTRAPSFELRNAGVGPDPLTLERVTRTADFAVVLLLRDHHCPKCRNQVRTVAEHARAFAELNAVVLPVLPEPFERAREWQEQFDLPYPLLADPDKELGEQYDQPTRFGVLGRFHDVIGRMPATVILDTRSGEPEVVYTYEGDSPGDRPAPETLIDAVGDLRASFVFDCSLVDC